MSSVSMQIQKYAIEKDWEIILPKDYYNEYEQVSYSYKNGNDKYRIDTYYESENETYIRFYINDILSFDKDIFTLEKFIQCLPK